MSHEKPPPDYKSASQHLVDNFPQSMIMRANIHCFSHTVIKYIIPQIVKHIYGVCDIILLNGGVIAITMANKIVQLIDKNNDNLYPVAGSLKSGSVTTSTILDEAVTYDKIDFATMNWANGITIGNYNNTPIKVKVLSGTMPSSVNTWKSVGSIGSNHTVLGALGSFIDGNTNYPFPGTNSSETNAIYVDSTGSVNVKSDYNYSLGKACKVMVIYL